MGLDIIDLSFTEFMNKDGNPDQEKYCFKWLESYAIQNGLLVGSALVVVIINVITCFIFEKIVFIEKNLTVNDETYG